MERGKIKVEGVIIAVPSARETAYEITRRVDSTGAYLGLLLQHTLRDPALSGRDRALVAELVYGVQRQRNKLDYVIMNFSRRPLQEIEPEVLDVLRIGVYQIMAMRIPAHAAVNETVDLGKKVLHPGASSFVNAVLRNTVKGLGELEWPSREDLAYYLEILYSHPRWLIDYLLPMLGNESTEALCAADNRFPGITLRANLARAGRSELMARIQACGGHCQPSRYLVEGIVKVGLPRNLLLELIEGGLCVVQDESSMLVSHAVAPQPRSLVVDACAAPGGKASHLALLGGESCRVIAVDRNRRRISAMNKVVERLGLENVDVIEGDSSRLGDYLSQPPDAVLVDAPCSGLGALRRRPELKWRRRREDLERLAETQLAILHGCADAVRPGGVLVYSVCTYSREETTDVVDRFLRSRADYELDDIIPFLPAGLRPFPGPFPHIQLMPHLHGMEGMFISRFVRRS
jgi:16S rRNA (cytosine967-C5)-methyltransferase